MVDGQLREMDDVQARSIFKSNLKILLMSEKVTLLSCMQSFTVRAKSIEE